MKKQSALEGAVKAIRAETGLNVEKDAGVATIRSTFIRAFQSQFDRESRPSRLFSPDQALE